MTLNEYQEKAISSIQPYQSQDQENFFLGFLGLAGEAGSVLTTLKKLIRDGEGFGSFSDKLKEELGDVLWYISAIASHYNMKLEEIAEMNISKTSDRFLEPALAVERFDKNYSEQFPDTFTVDFIETEGQNGLPEVKMIWERAGSQVSIELGDPLTDNAKIPNNYRYHDIFHLGHIAFLGWSPVMRHLMQLKRKSDPVALDAEDRGRPQVAEEAVTLIVFNYAKSNMMLKASDRIDTELLNTVKQLVMDLEISGVSALVWEETILESYKVFHQVVENRGGKVLVSPKERVLKYVSE